MQLQRSSKSCFRRLASTLEDTRRSPRWSGGSPNAWSYWEELSSFSHGNSRESSPGQSVLPNLHLSKDLDELRYAMLNAERFHAAVFIGGMDGVEKEWRNVQALPRQTDIPMFPLASTGGAALLLWESDSIVRRYPEDLRSALRADFNYVPLFRKLLDMSP